MKKAFLTAMIVVTVLVCGMMLAYLLYKIIPAEQTMPAATEVKTKVITKEVRVPAVPEKKRLKSIIKATQDKVVQIESSSGQGSGFLYNDKGDIVTNAHVVGYDTNVLIKMSDKKTYQGQIIGRGDHTDIALVRVPELANTKPLHMNTKKAELGDDVVALGSPLGLQNTVTIGIISGMDRSFTLDPFIYENLYQITAPISPGNSGGPIVSGLDGSVLGINSVKYTTTENIGFSIPIYAILPTLKEWSKNPMKLPDYEEDYDFEVPEYDGDITEDYEDYDEGYGTDAGLDMDEDYSEEEPYEDDSYYYITEDDAINTVYTYYDFVNNGDYQSAYNLIGGNWKASSPSLEKFAAGYANTLSTTVTDYSTQDNEDGTFQVNITLEAQENVNDTERTSYYDMSYIVGLEENIPKLLGGESR